MKKERIKNQIKSNKMKNEAYIIIPNGKEAKNITGKMVDGKLQICYDLQDKFEPKDGDFVISSTGLIFIFKKDLGDTYCERCAESYIGIERKSGNIHTNLFFVINKGRFATEQEKSEFLERLEKECNKRWNEKNKCLEDIYVPKFGDVVKVCIDTEYPGMRNYMICIFPNKAIPSKSDTAFFDIANLSRTGNVCYVCGFFSKNDIVQASEFEKKELFDKLEKIGKRWNPEKKCIEDIDRNEKLSKEFFVLTRPLMKFIRKNYHPHCTIIIDSEHAELLEGKTGYKFKKSKAE